VIVKHKECSKTTRYKNNSQETGPTKENEPNKIKEQQSRKTQMEPPQKKLEQQ
jgi:hypothetical protein